MESTPRWILATAFSLVLGISPAAYAAQRPNILIVMSDDQSASDLGCYGNPDVKTPNLDRFAGQGMRFTRAFTATAMCAPTRQQLYTGIFPVRNGAYPNHSRVKRGTKSIVHHLQALGYRVGLAGKKHFGPPDSFPFESLGDNQKKYNAMEQFINRDKTQPYCLVVTSHSPHLPWNQGDASAYPPSELTVPAQLVDTPETRVSLSKYYAEITDFDREVGLCLDLVAGSGQQDNTIVLYTSEQGAQFPHGKWTCYDMGLQTAMIVRWPGHVKPGSTTDAMVQYVDVLPTLMDAVEGKPIEGLDGRSFLAVLLGEDDKHNEFVYGVHTTRGIIAGSESYPIRSIRSETHKLIWNLNFQSRFQNITTNGRDTGAYWNSWVEKAKTDTHARRLVLGYQFRPEFELYDLRSDPLELDNLADDVASQELVQALHARLRLWMDRQGDLGLETEMRAKERQGKAGRK